MSSDPMDELGRAVLSDELQQLSDLMESADIEAASDFIEFNNVKIVNRPGYGKTMMIPAGFFDDIKMIEESAKFTAEDFRHAANIMGRKIGERIAEGIDHAFPPQPITIEGSWNEDEPLFIEGIPSAFAPMINRMPKFRQIGYSIGHYMNSFVEPTPAKPKRQRKPNKRELRRVKQRAARKSRGTR